MTSRALTVARTQLEEEKRKASVARRSEDTQRTMAA